MNENTLMRGKKVIWCVKHENLELKLRETMSVIGTYNKLKERLRH